MRHVLSASGAKPAGRLSARCRGCLPHAGLTSTVWQWARPKIPTSPGSRSWSWETTAFWSRSASSSRRSSRSSRSSISPARISSSRDLTLIQINATPDQRPEIKAPVDSYRGRIVDIGPEQLMIEISGQEKKIEAFIEAVRPYGIRELARTGRIALVRGSRPVKPEETAAPDADESTPTVLGHSNL